MSSPSFLGVATQKKGPRGSSSCLIADNSLLPWPCPRLVYAEKVVQHIWSNHFFFAQQPTQQPSGFYFPSGCTKCAGPLMAAMRVRCFPAVFPTDFPGFNFVASTCRVYEMPNKAQYSTQHLDQFWLVEPLNLPKCHASTNKIYGDCYPLAISVSIYILYLFIYIYMYIYLYIYILFYCIWDILWSYVSTW